MSSLMEAGLISFLCSFIGYLAPAIEEERGGGRRGSDWCSIGIVGAVGAGRVL